MLVYDTEGLNIRFGDDLADVEQYLVSAPHQWDSVRQSATHESTLEWDLSLGYDGALHMARDGWSEGAANMHKGLQALPAPTNRHADERYDVGGHFPDVPRYLAGEPAHMLTRGKRQGNPPVVHLVVNGAAMREVTGREYANYGLAVAAAIDFLEASGRRVELDAVSAGFISARGVMQRIVVGWKVKRAAEHIDLSSVAFSTAHPGAYRRLGFALMERTPGRYATDSYRTPTPMKRTELAIIGADNAYGIEGIRQASGACATVHGALRFVARQINAAVGEELVVLE